MCEKNVGKTSLSPLFCSTIPITKYHNMSGWGTAEGTYGEIDNWKQFFNFAHFICIS